MENAQARPRLLQMATDVPEEVATLLPDGVYPCVVDGVIVPEPWCALLCALQALQRLTPAACRFSRRVDGDFSSNCFANKSVGEKCCDYSKTDEEECVARFQGYGSKAVRDWMALCRR